MLDYTPAFCYFAGWCYELLRWLEQFIQIGHKKAATLLYVR